MSKTHIEYIRRGYPANWQEIKERIRFERAKGRCECRGECGFNHAGKPGRSARCNAAHGVADPQTGQAIELQTAHLNHDKSDCRDDNLRAFCARCHSRYDAPEKRRRRQERERAGRADRDLFEDAK